MAEETSEKKARTARVADPEIQALAKLDDILADLSDDECRRCLLWLITRYIPGTEAVLGTKAKE